MEWNVQNKLISQKKKHGFEWFWMFELFPDWVKYLLWDSNVFAKKNFKQATSYKQCFIMFIKIFGF